jgi:CheY-like chemotaxis protein
VHSQEVCAHRQLHESDLILLDQQMHGMDAFQVIEALNAIDADPSLPVIGQTTQPGH